MHVLERKSHATKVYHVNELTTLIAQNKAEYTEPLIDFADLARSQKLTCATTSRQEVPRRLKGGRRGWCSAWHLHYSELRVSECFTASWKGECLMFSLIGAKSFGERTRGQVQNHSEFSGRCESKSIFPFPEFPEYVQVGFLSTRIYSGSHASTSSKSACGQNLEIRSIHVLRSPL